jgi:hypothetical protein
MKKRNWWIFGIIFVCIGIIVILEILLFKTDTLSVPLFIILDGLTIMMLSFILISIDNK